MKLIFSWTENQNRFSPSCTSSFSNAEGFSPLACLLMDDGGQIASNTVPWLYEGIAKINSIRKSKLASIDWSRDAWGAEIDKKRVKIYSLFDNDCFEIVSLEGFEKVLLAWLGFVSERPAVGASVELDI